MVDSVAVTAFFETTVVYNTLPTITGDWSFDWTTPTTVDFVGELDMGSFIQSMTVVDGGDFFGTMDGTISTNDANHAFSGTAAWDDGTKTLSYSFLGASNSGAGSTYTETSSSCTDNGEIFGNTICGTWAATTAEWEGFDLTLVFAPDLSTYAGTLIANENSGDGLTASTTLITYSIAGTNAIPVPAAAWLFGSALVGLAGIGRKRG